MESGVYFRTRLECFDVLLFDNESAASDNFLKKVLYNRDLTKKHRNFTRADVKQELDIAGVDPQEYSLNGIDFADQYVLDTSDGRWTVSFSERGSRREIAEFGRETDAALHLLNRVLVSKERQNAPVRSQRNSRIEPSVGWREYYPNIDGTPFSSSFLFAHNPIGTSISGMAVAQSRAWNRNGAVCVVPVPDQLRVLQMIDPNKVLAGRWIASENDWFDIPLNFPEEPFVNSQFLLRIRRSNGCKTLCVNRDCRNGEDISFCVPNNEVVPSA